MAATPSSPQAVLAREAAGRVRAAVGAALSGLLTLGGSIGLAIALADRPHVLLLDALRDAAGEPIPGGGGLRSAQVLFYDEHATGIVAGAVVIAAGALALVLPLTYLYAAARARRPQTPNVALVMAVAGPVALAIAQLMLHGGLVARSHDFAASSDHGSQAAHDVFGAGVVVAGQLLWQAAVIAIGFAFVVLCLNAMRAGLLTRFMGVLGIIVGVLFVIPVGSPLPIVQTFWLVALAALILGRWPSGAPPAWSTGVAVPWPSQQDLRAARERAAPRQQQSPGPDAEQASGRREKQSSRPHPASKKKRRRR